MSLPIPLPPFLFIPAVFLITFFSTRTADGKPPAGLVWLLLAGGLYLFFLIQSGYPEKLKLHLIISGFSAVAMGCGFIGNGLDEMGGMTAFFLPVCLIVILLGVALPAAFRRRPPVSPQVIRDINKLLLRIVLWSFLPAVLLGGGLVLAIATQFPPLLFFYLCLGLPLALLGILDGRDNTGAPIIIALYFYLLSFLVMTVILGIRTLAKHKTSR